MQSVQLATLNIRERPTTASAFDGCHLAITQVRSLQCSELIVEPAAALGIARILENRDRFQGMTVATILCGGNISTTDFEMLITERGR